MFKGGGVQYFMWIFKSFSIIFPRDVVIFCKNLVIVLLYAMERASIILFLSVMDESKYGKVLKI